MKLDKISVKNILGVKHAEITTDKPIIAVFGKNEAGKSSMIDAISMALSGALKRVSLKKDAGHLVNGDDTGLIEIVSEERDFFTSITKKGSITSEQGIEPSPALPYVLNASTFTAVTPDERRKLLFQISGCKATQDEVKGRMVSRGINESMAERILPFLRAGFPEAQKEAQSKAREEKASWKTLTGEAYGEKKAEEWSLSAEGNIEEIQNAVATKDKEFSELEQELEGLNRSFGAMNTKRETIKSRREEIDGLKETAGKVDRFKRKLELDRKALAEWKSKHEQMKLASHGISKDDTACHCPECGSELIFVAKDKKLIPHGDLRGNEDEAVNLVECDRQVQLFTKSVQSGERDLSMAELAESVRTKLADIETEAGTEEFSDGAFDALKAKIDELKLTRKTLLDTKNKLVDQERCLREADQVTSKAYAHHKNVEAWEKIAAALAPDGIPGEILQEAIKPFNDRLKLVADLAGWKVPSVDNNLNISVAGLPYTLISESAKWRADFILTEAISYISGIKLLVMDRYDVLDGAGRGLLLGLLDELIYVNAFDTALVMGTLKREQANSIANAFDTVAVHWIEEGMLEQIITEETEA